MWYWKNISLSNRIIMYLLCPPSNSLFIDSSLQASDTEIFHRWVVGKEHTQMKFPNGHSASSMIFFLSDHY